MSMTSAETHLSARLQQKIEADRIAAEKLMMNELDRLAENLSLVSRAALNSIGAEWTNGAQNMRAELQTHSATFRQNLSTLTQSVIRATAEIEVTFQTSQRRLKRMTLWFPVSLLIVMVVSSVGAWLWIKFLQSTAAQLDAEIRTSRATLSDLSTDGMTLMKTEQGRFLLLPKTTETGWSCGDNPCLRLPEK